mmetsp:Transcript_23221/g.41344  ORF Transcript_23221/g.41344 Transcript_23221/m.41344 type:complete len:164 (+) Transcript_23221:71-562(+)
MSEWNARLPEPESSSCPRWNTLQHDYEDSSDPQSHGLVPEIETIWESHWLEVPSARNPSRLPKSGTSNYFEEEIEKYANPPPDWLFNVNEVDVSFSSLDSDPRGSCTSLGEDILDCHKQPANDLADLDPKLVHDLYSQSSLDQWFSDSREFSEVPFEYDIDSI